MTYGLDLLVDEATGDLDITGNDFNIVENTSQSLRQRIELRLNTWQGEWDYNLIFGLPVRQRIIGLGLNQSQVDAEFIAQISLEPDVTAIRDLTSEWDPNTRSYTLTRVDVYNDNEVYSLSLTNPEAVRYSYPEPQDIADTNVCSFREDFIIPANDLYFHMNYELPITGVSTWWNTWVI